MFGGGKRINSTGPSRALSLPVGRNARGQNPNPKKQRSGSDAGDANPAAEIPPRPGLGRSSSYTKLTKLRQQQQQQQRGSRSPPESPTGVPKRPASLRSMKRSDSPSKPRAPRRHTSMRSSSKRRSKSPSELSAPKRHTSMISPKPRSKSPSDDSPAQKPSSMRSLKSRSKSPADEAPRRPHSMRSMKQRSKSPVMRKKDLVTPVASSTKSSKQSHRMKSPRGGGTHKSHKPRSPRTPKIKPVPKRTDDEQIIPPDLENTPPGELSSDIKGGDLDDMPSLVDDSVVRDTLEAERGGRQWKITEDTPAGHAEERLVMVSAIEHDDQSGDWGIDDSEFLEEDEDIIEDEDEHSLAVARSRGLNSLPTDPSSANGSSNQVDVNADRDRFAPAFNNRDRWKHGEKLEDKSPDVERAVSADESLISDTNGEEDLESSSEISKLAAEKWEQPSLFPDEGVPDDGGDEGNDRTPATAKRSGGNRRPGRMKAAPDLEVESLRKDDATSNSSFTESTTEPLVSTPKRKSSRRQKKPPSSLQSSTGRQEKKGSESTGRNSHRQSAHRPRKERDALHAQKHRKVPDDIPTTLSPDGTVQSPMTSSLRSPMSSSLTSTANSQIMTSSRSQQQHQSLKALRRHHAANRHPTSKSKRHPNSSLNDHVGSSRDHSGTVEVDDDTLGASTISTNFTTTQRTRGDNTVSERSLFQSDRTGSSQIPRIPQRHIEESDSEDSDEDEKNHPQQTTRTKDNQISAIQKAAMTAEDLFSRNASVDKPVGGRNDFSTVLRRPSGEGDDLLEMGDEDFSLGSADQTDGTPQPAAFLQLNPSEHGVVIEADIVDTKTGEFHTEALLQVDPGATQSVSIEPKDSSGVISCDKSEQLEKVNEETVVDLSKRIYGVGADGSPGKNKKKSRLGLFKKMASWKGKVSLDEEKDK